MSRVRSGYPSGMRTPCPAAVLVLLACSPLPAQASRPDPVAEGLTRARPLAAEERWKALAWRTSLAEALAESQTCGKPVFLFGYDGVADTGLC